ncbi:CD209 antigen-like protein E [Phycodurus eques]|uniref:CD209 antigen-like protein E n=1 Tax=Phycodurus eques TaxID=693459 RepID=UPI002ACDD540|nr:CD209 antigen-like protein E [Phycodurus eques]
MAVVFHSNGPQVSIEVGEYEQFPKNGQADTTEKTLPKSRPIYVVLVGFGLLCVLQAVLNITLRLSHSTTEESCPQGWLQFSGSCYYISSQRRSWDNSRRDCLQRDADLVIIDSRQEQAFLTGFTKATWIGMSDRDHEGIWIWVNGTPVKKNRLRWAPGQPDGAFGGEYCGDLRTMMNFIGLNDSNCSVRSQWICEKIL